jgi:SulP family sulfate permease
MFTLFCCLPFAFGHDVQDPGLIFLSAMAISICNSLEKEKNSPWKKKSSLLL